MGERSGRRNRRERWGNGEGGKRRGRGERYSEGRQEEGKERGGRGKRAWWKRERGSEGGRMHIKDIPQRKHPILHPTNCLFQLLRPGLGPI